MPRVRHEPAPLQRVSSGSFAVAGHVKRVFAVEQAARLLVPVTKETGEPPVLRHSEVTAFENEDEHLPQLSNHKRQHAEGRLSACVRRDSSSNAGPPHSPRAACIGQLTGIKQTELSHHFHAEKREVGLTGLRLPAAFDPQLQPKKTKFFVSTLVDRHKT